MQEDTTVARPYAQAAFQQAGEEGDFESWSELLRRLSRLVQDPLMRPVLNNPKVSDRQLLELATEIAGRPTPTGLNFIKVLIAAGRLGHVPRIASLFEERRAQAEGRVEVRVTSAYELDPGQTDRIAAAMSKRLGKRASVTASVDRSLIGGMIVRAGDSVIDASIRGRLDGLRNSLIG